MVGRKATDLNRQPGCLVKGSPAFFLRVFLWQTENTVRLQQTASVQIDNHFINPAG